MRVYLVTYGPNLSESDAELSNALAELGARRVLPATWLLQSELGAAWIRERLVQAMDGEVSLLVVRVEGEASWQNVDGSSWLQETLGGL